VIDLIKRSLDAARADPERAEWFERWQRDAQVAAEAYADALARGETPKFNKALVDKLRRWLYVHVFENKCAYCEGRVEPQSFVHGEHWRPKGEVVVRSGGRDVKVERAGREHPGYWWLAYEWTNLLPACSQCNTGKGKNSQFPVANTHVFDPAEVADLEDLDRKEGPLLLHPMRGEDPRLHLRFNDLGQIKARDDSPLGQHSIEVFDLRREALIDHRGEQIRLSRDSVLLALVESGSVDDFEQSLQPWIGTEALYSAAVREHVERRVHEHVAQKRAELAALEARATEFGEPTV
jgi:hypothetical protein